MGKNEYQRAYYHTHPEYRQTVIDRATQWRKANPDKYRPISRRCVKQWIKEHPDKHRQYQRERFTRLKLEFLNAYGCKCVCCGITEPAFLTLEHLNHDGKAHAKAVGGAGPPVYRDLKKRGWPKDGYTLLCWNCNCATRYGKQCPHKF